MTFSIKQPKEKLILINDRVFVSEKGKIYLRTTDGHLFEILKTKEI
jgi:hypothetical protein